MDETMKPNLSGVAETLLITLYIRAMESQRPDTLIKDERAEALVRAIHGGKWLPVAEGRFVGGMFTKNHPGLERLGMRFFIACCGLGFRGGDFRNPVAISAWTASIRPLLIQ